MPITPVDTLRVLAVLGLVPATTEYGLVGFAVMFLVTGGCMIPRALGSAGWLDGLWCASFLFSAWAALLDWYAVVPGLDLAVHAVVTGLLGLLAWELVRRAGLLTRDAKRARVAAVVVTVTGATTLATLWEIGEWLGYTYLDDSIQVGYEDTLTDVIAGVLGALVAGSLAFFAVRNEQPAPAMEPAR